MVQPVLARRPSSRGMGPVLLSRVRAVPRRLVWLWRVLLRPWS